jgi:glycerol-3-phosphate dehydrogenase
VAQAFTFLHERDRRPVFVFPWEGATVVGTTDLDHHEDLDQSASISAKNSTICWRPARNSFPAQK